MGRTKVTLDPSLDVRMPIGELLKKISKERHVSVKVLTQKSGFERANIYRTFKREVMEDHEITDWAELLGVDRDTIYKRWVGIEAPVVPDFKYTRKNLADQVRQSTTEIENLRRQLELKDAQISVLKELLIGSPDTSAELINQIHRMPSLMAG